MDLCKTKKKALKKGTKIDVKEFQKNILKKSKMDKNKCPKKCPKWFRAIKNLLKTLHFHISFYIIVDTFNKSITICLLQGIFHKFVK